MYEKLKKLHDYLESNGFADEANSIMSLSNDNANYPGAARGALCDTVIKEGSDYWMVNCGIYNEYSYALWKGPSKDAGPRFGGDGWVASEVASGPQKVGKEKAWKTLETRRKELEKERWAEIQRERESAGSKYDDVLINEDVESEYDGAILGEGMAHSPSHYSITNPEGAAKAERMLSRPGSEGEAVVYTEPEIVSGDNWIDIMDKYFDENSYTSMKRKLSSDDPDINDSKFENGTRSFTVHNRSEHNRHQPEIIVLMSKTHANDDPLLEKFDVKVFEETPEYSEYRRMSRKEREGSDISGEDIKRWSDNSIGSASNISLGGRGMNALKYLDGRLPRRVNPIDKYVADADGQQLNSDYDPELVREIRWDKLHRFLSKLAPKDGPPYA
jgi:hypothetical protein